MNNVTKGILIAAGVLITCILISMGIYLTTHGQDAGAAMARDINKVTAAISNNEVNDYVMDEVTGADVVNFIRKFHEDLDIFTLQRTVAGTQGVQWKGTNISANNSGIVLNYNAIAWGDMNSVPSSVLELSDSTNTFKFSVQNFAGNKYVLSEDNFTKNIPGTSMYINPNNKYRGFTIVNSNDVITGLYFVQQDDVQVAISPGGGTGGTGSTGGSGNVPSSGAGSGTGTVGGNVDSSVILAMSQTINTVADAVTRLTSEVTALKDNIYNAQEGSSGSTGSGSTDMSGLQSQIGTLSSKYLELTAALNEVKATLKNSMAGTDISDIKSGVNSNSEAIAGTLAKIELITEKLNLIESKLTQLSSKNNSTAEPGTGADDTVFGAGMSTGTGTTASINTLSSINSDLVGVTDLILEVTSELQSDDAAKLSETVESVRGSLEEAAVVTDMIDEEIAK